MSKFESAAQLIRHWVWIAPIVLGVAFIAGGAYMVIEGRSAHDEVRDSLVLESITVSGDAEAFAGEQVDSPEEAQAQSDAILHHTLVGSGGYLYAEQGRFLLPEGNYMLPNGTYMAGGGGSSDGGTTTDVTLAATDDGGNPVNVTTDATLAAKDSSDKPVPAWTGSAELAAKDANGNPIANPLRNTAKDSAFLRTSLGVAVMGFKVADLVMGLGLFLVALGLMNVFIISPVTYWATVVANEHERARQTAAAKETAPGTHQQTA